MPLQQLHSLPATVRGTSQEAPSFTDVRQASSRDAQEQFFNETEVELPVAQRGSSVSDVRSTLERLRLKDEQVSRDLSARPAERSNAVAPIAGQREGEQIQAPLGATGDSLAQFVSEPPLGRLPSSQSPVRQPASRQHAT